MDASITFRLPALAVSREEGNSTAAVTEHSSLEAGFSDEQLMAEVCQGSKEALGVLFHRYARLVHAVSDRILRDQAEADDLLQEIFLFLYRRAGAFDSSKSSARSWIVQMAYHRAIDRRRELQFRQFYSQVALTGASEVQDPNANAREATVSLEGVVGNTTIEGLLNTLTEDQRNTLGLYFYEGYTFGEIAAKLDQSLGNVRNHYYRGLEKLRKQVFKGKLRGQNGRGRK